MFTKLRDTFLRFTLEFLYRIDFMLRTKYLRLESDEDILGKEDSLKFRLVMQKMVISLAFFY